MRRIGTGNNNYDMDGNETKREPIGGARAKSDRISEPAGTWTVARNMQNTAGTNNDKSVRDAAGAN
jgi:hypothetical protein